MTSPSQIRLRFAPSPNGYLHLGHAYSALLNDAVAHVLGGVLLVRMEDIDLERCKPHFETAIMHDLEWLGVRFASNILRQSERFGAYSEMIAKLWASDLVYPAFWSRAQIKAFVKEKNDWPRDPDGSPFYPGPERTWSRVEKEAALQSGNPFSWRVDIGAAIQRTGLKEADIWGDVVLARKDTPASYHLSVVVDDAFQNITHIVRGQDLEPAACLHRLLQTLLELPAPRLVHHRLILDDEGRKLSKSDGSTALYHLRNAGASVEDIKRMTGFSDEEAVHLAAQFT
ncbi:MAG: tRNA glutamyl-Q(34) synthetase GluQRS [Pseudomonadota bacterium]